jgi:hypothetical protein
MSYLRFTLMLLRWWLGWVGHAARTRQTMCYETSVSAKRRLWRSLRKWEDNTECCGSVNWIQIARVSSCGYSDNLLFALLAQTSWSYAEMRWVASVSVSQTCDLSSVEVKQFRWPIVCNSWCPDETGHQDSENRFYNCCHCSKRTRLLFGSFYSVRLIVALLWLSPCNVLPSRLPQLETGILLC